MIWDMNFSTRRGQCSNMSSKLVCKLFKCVLMFIIKLLCWLTVFASLCWRFWLSLRQPVLCHSPLLWQTRLSLWLPECSCCPHTQGEPHRGGWENSEVMRTERKEKSLTLWIWTMATWIKTPDIMASFVHGSLRTGGVGWWGRSHCPDASLTSISLSLH